MAGAGGEGPLFAPIPTEEDVVSQVPLAELEGLSPDLLKVLSDAGYSLLNDVLDLERDDLLSSRA